MINKVLLIGRLGKDPEIRHFENNARVANFTLATNERYTDRNGQRQELTEWHDIAVWGNQADIAMNYLKKGSLVYVEGRLKRRSWEDKDGNKRSTVEIVADLFKMLERKEEGMSHPTNEYTQVAQPTESNDKKQETQNDDLPF